MSGQGPKDSRTCLEVSTGTPQGEQVRIFAEDEDNYLDGKLIPTSPTVLRRQT